MENKPKHSEINLEDGVNTSDSVSIETKLERNKVKHGLLSLHIALTTAISLIGFVFIGIAIVFILYIISILTIFYLPGYKEKIITIEKEKF